MGDEIHIASLVVHAAPAQMQGVVDFVGSMDGAKVHAAAPTGKLVVTLEALSGEDIVAAVNRIQRAEGVLAATLVFQYSDTREAMLEELSHAD